MYTITTKLFPDMILFQVTGKVLLPNAIQFQEEIAQLFEAQKVYEGCIDLSEMEKMDNSGIGALVSLSDHFIKEGRFISLYSPKEEIKELIKSIGIEKFFTIYDTKQELRHHSLSEAS